MVDKLLGDWNIEKQQSNQEESKITVEKKDIDKAKSDKKPNDQLIRVIKGYAVYNNLHLGKGQYGAVCKAKLASEIKNKNAQIFACKIMEVANVSQSELACIEKEVMIHSRVKAKNCVHLYNSFKTQSNMYMMMDYCNGFDLA